MSDVQVTLVHSPDGDWIGMYVDGKLVDQGHSLQERDVIESLITAIPLDGVSLAPPRWDWDPEEDGGHLPDKLSDVTFNGS